MLEKDIPPDSGRKEQAGDCALEFHHISVIASDYEEAVRFYVDYMGFEIFRESFSVNKNAKINAIIFVLFLIFILSSRLS